jgi:rod shape-determining protein MreD
LLSRPSAFPRLRFTAALRAAVSLLVSVVLWTLLAEANHTLGGFHVYLFLGALFVTPAALSFSLRDGLLAAVPAGLLFDATTPVPFGLHALLFALTLTTLHRLRERLPHEDTAAQVAIALIANLALFLVFSFTQLSRLPEPGAVWPRLIVDLLCSQLVLAAIGPWFFALHARALALARVARPEPL